MQAYFLSITSIFNRSILTPVEKKNWPLYIAGRALFFFQAGWCMQILVAGALDPTIVRTPLRV